MKNIVKITIIMLLAGFWPPIFADTGTSVTVTTTTTNDNSMNEADTRIVSEIYAQYAKDSALIATALTVNCKDGIVTLTGTVTAQSQADQAVISAKSVAGVKDVRSSIVVTTNPDIHDPAKPANY